MREYTEPTPIDLQAFSTGRILKESWEICTKYFGALVMPMFLILVPSIFLAYITENKAFDMIHRAYFTFIVPLVMIGIHRAVLNLKEKGIRPTFNETWREGNECWWRGIKANWYSQLALGLSMLGSFLLLLPGILVMHSDEMVGWLLLAVGIPAAIALLTWCTLRIWLTMPAMADGQTSSRKAFNISLSLTEGKVRKLLPFAYAFIGILLGLALALFMVFMIAAIISDGRDESMEALGELIFIPLVASFIFGLTYGMTVSTLTYIALRPAPKEEPIQAGQG
jgi:membrane-anchored glycerophosphoryl diester phosphodiesterase (GDPDase)